jgi:hypothetical protein
VLYMKMLNIINNKFNEVIINNLFDGTGIQKKKTKWHNGRRLGYTNITNIKDIGFGRRIGGESEQSSIERSS